MSHRCVGLFLISELPTVLLCSYRFRFRFRFVGLRPVSKTTPKSRDHNYGTCTVHAPPFFNVISTATSSNMMIKLNSLCATLPPISQSTGSVGVLWGCTIAVYSHLTCALQIKRATCVRACVGITAARHSSHCPRTGCLTHTHRSASPPSPRGWKMARVCSRPRALAWSSSTAE
jgi:hypothetical protein